MGIVTPDDGSTTHSRNGTGFLIAPDLVVTCFHVVSGANAATFALPSRKAVPVVGIVAEDAANDLVILSISSGRDERAPLDLAPAAPTAGDRLQVYGYPEGATPMMGWACVTECGPSCGMVEAILASCGLGHGFSGGPALNARGQVVGVASIVNGPMQGQKGEIISACLTLVPASRIRAMKAGPPRLLSSWTESRRAKATADIAESLGVAAMGAGNHAEAIRQFQRATQMDPQGWTSWSNIAVAFSQTKRYEDAVSAGRRALAIKPKYPEAYETLCCALLSLRRNAEAVSAGLAAVEMRPHWDKMRWVLGAVYVLTGQNAKAREQYQILQKLNPVAAQDLLTQIEAIEAETGKRSGKAP